MSGARSFRSTLLWGAMFAAGGLLIFSHLSHALGVRAFTHVFRFGGSALFWSLGAVFVVAAILLIRSGLSPFDRLRAALVAVRQGTALRIDGKYPSEIQPLVNDLNDLLVHNDEMVRRAQSKAGDLAHGLKTPLAILTLEAERTAASGNTELAESIRQQVERMRRQVDYHLAQARAAASGTTLGVRTSVKDSVEGLTRTMLRLHADRGLTIDVNIHPEHSFHGQRQDLDEMLGNLLDNACKWAKSRVVVESSSDSGRISITVDDDGPGLEPAMRETVLQRGIRADEAAPGSGFGLAIVRDLAELYGGSIELHSSAMGALRAILKLPSS